MQIGVNGFDHQVVVVSLEKKDYVVDVGFGGQVNSQLSRVVLVVEMLMRALQSNSWSIAP